MRTTIDGAGRMVIPKPIRDAAGLERGAEVEVRFRDGRIEVEPASVPMRLVRRARRTVIEAEGDVPALTADEVREALERVRR
jgi:AbrB family looped-hinge helix DNA binding protein